MIQLRRLNQVSLNPHPGFNYFLMCRDPPPHDHLHRPYHPHHPRYLILFPHYPHNHLGKSHHPKTARRLTFQLRFRSGAHWAGKFPLRVLVSAHLVISINLLFGLFDNILARSFDYAMYDRIKLLPCTPSCQVLKEGSCPPLVVSACNNLFSHDIRLKREMFQVSE